MKVFFLRYKKLHIWFLCALAAAVFFHLGKGSRPLMNALTEGLTQPLKTALGTLCACVPFSVAELLLFAAVGVLILYLAAFAGALLRSGAARGRVAYSRGLGLVCVVLSLYSAFCLLWGANYYTDTFQDRSGIHAQPVSVAQLAAVTEQFVQRLNALTDAVPRTEEGVFSASRDEIYAAAPEIYRGAEALYPFLAMQDHVPKRITFSKFMSETNFTGFFFPFTGEANLNNDSPSCILPATIAHELSHRRGVASEQECNFLAVLVCEESGNAVYEYSGALFGFIHLSNALYRADRAAWEALHAELAQSVRADLRANNAYWAQFDGKTAEVSQKTYDSFLKGYGDADGIQSYGAVVDLLVAYYGT